jgi:uncharacterized linocin/CFP29 family protein
MNILKKSLAPITDAAWNDINEEAAEIFNSVLSARKFVDVSQPQGLDFGGVHTGRIEIASKKKDTVRYGLNQVKPLVESRVGFSLDIWEIDNAARGAEDIDLQPMEEAAREIASFEERAVYLGLEKAGIAGLKNQSVHDPVAFPDSTDDLLTALSTQLARFNRRGIEGPYSLVVSEDDWERLSIQYEGYPLRKQLKHLLKGSIILSPFVEDAYLVSERGGDFRLTLGQDLSIGYNFHDKDSVELYFTESFTFQCFEPAAVAVFTKSD